MAVEPLRHYIEAGDGVAVFLRVAMLATSFWSCLPSGALMVFLLIAYLLLVQSMRWRVYSRVHRKYAYLMSDLTRMTPAEAQDIMHASTVWDMPAVTSNALSYAMFRTYAIVRLHWT